MSKGDMLGSALAEVAGPLKDFFEKIGGDEGEQWLAAFKKFLRKENPWPEFPIWKTIKIGTGLKTGNDFRRALKDGNFKFGVRTEYNLDKPAFTRTIAVEEGEIDLVKITVGELGFKEGVPREATCERAKKLGLELCPPEVGPQLRLQYKDQPKGEEILIGMKPLPDADDEPSLFCVESNDSELWLSSYRSDRGISGLGEQWVFVLPRK